ncbi:MAG: tetratricopeptide repeat protein [Akkermansiaceae bacterium]
MSFTKRILTALLATSLLSPAQEAGNADNKNAKPELPQFVVDIRNLPDDKRKEYQDLFVRCDQLFKQRRIFECLENLYKLHKIYKGNPSTTNLQGACYVEFRNFDKARLAFEKTLAIQPDNFNVRFNIAEIEFVTQNWGKALELLTALDKESEDEGSKHANMNPLIKFKMILCMLKIDNVDGAQKMIAATDFLDDSLLHYYGTAALLYHNDQGREAEVWLARGGRIFRDPGRIAPWQDTLIEFGYIKSFYGGDLEVEQNNPAGADE